MKSLFQVDQWNIIENSIHKEDFRFTESVMSIGNGHMGMRGNFEETYTGDTHKGTYLAGIYYPDKTRVGWWKNGYPEYFSKVLNAPDFSEIKVFINNYEIDLNKMKIIDYKRILHMKEGYLERECIVEDEKGNQTKLQATRFFSIAKKELVVMKYSVTPLNHDCTVTFLPAINGDIRNEDANYDEDFWLAVTSECSEGEGSICVRTKKTEFDVAVSMVVSVNNSQFTCKEVCTKERFVSNVWEGSVVKGETAAVYKYIGVTTSRYYEKDLVLQKAKNVAKEAKSKGFSALFQEQKDAWHKRWENADIIIEGDDSAQQAIRFSLFQLYSTYYGDDATLNIGPKGFTGEKYGGSTYWDTEAFCFPVYLATADEKVAENLLLYRYNQLEQAKANARKLGLQGALYPMVTMDGYESHNEWEITFEEIHRNGAICYAIYNYTNYTGNKKYLYECGFHVLVEVSRFFASRVHFQPKKQVYMIHGVTGPNEYENNVNNNWYTNQMAEWVLQYTLDTYEAMKQENEELLSKWEETINLSEDERIKWQEITEKMYKPFDEELQIFVQHDGFLDKELRSVSSLEEADLPLNQKWSWDKILRSCFIKQADVIQGLYFLGDRFTLDEKKRNFDFYEPMTVHESSLSPCIYAVVAAELGYKEKAYELYMRTSRLDLDNYNNDTEDGLHITSMSGSWLAIVQGFAGMRTWNNELSFSPYLPKCWSGYSFKIIYRNHHLQIKIDENKVMIKQEKGTKLKVKVLEKVIELNGVEEKSVEMKS